MFNYFGFTGFNGFMQIWAKQGLVSDGWAKPHAPMVEGFNHGIRQGVVPHTQIKELVKYSRFVGFAVRVRAIFLAEFQKHKQLFPGIDGEASECLFY